MFERAVAIASGIVAVAVGANASAQTAENPIREQFVMNAWSDPAKCNQGLAKRVSFVALAGDTDGLIGECVAVEGYWLGRALFASSRDAKARSSQTSNRLSGKRIGLYAQWESVGDPPASPARTIVVGRVGQCETQWPGAMMVMGYCHYTGGPILLVAETYRN